MSLSVFFLFKLSRLIMDDKYSILTTLLFLTNPETITLSSLLFTDTLFIFFVILSLYFYFRKITNDNFSENKMDYIILGILVGLASLTRVIGVYLVLFFLIMFFVVNNYKINLMLIKRYILFLFPYIIITTLFFIFKSFNFIVMKINPTTIMFNKELLFNIIYYFNPLFCVLSLTALFYYTRQRLVNYLKYFVICYILLLMLLVNIIFPRYFFVAIPFLSLISLEFITHLTTRYYKIIGLLMIFVIIVSFAAKLPNIPQLYSQNYYLAKDGCQDIKKFNISCKNRLDKSANEITTPYFSQEPLSNCIYATRINIDKDYSKIYAAYIDDSGIISIGNYSVYHNDVYIPLKESINLKKGEYNLTIDVQNDILTGGIGQIMVCKN